MTSFDTIINNLAVKVRASVIIEPESIPNIDLYMDQVTTFIDTALGPYKRNSEDKILTKTMINNYAKAKIFPAPVKKKYSKVHIMLLIMIYHSKSVLSIGDIGTLFSPVIHSKTKEAQENLTYDIYRGFVKLQALYAQIPSHDGNIIAIPEKKILEEYSDEAQRKILVVLSLAIRAYNEKQLAESVLDTYF